MNKYAIIYQWEGDLDILALSDTFEEAKVKAIKKIKSFVKDNEGIEGKFNFVEYVKEHEDRFCAVETKNSYEFEYNHGEFILQIKKIKI